MRAARGLERGSALAIRTGNLTGSGSTTHTVGKKASNAWGLYDMHGNVWEWCEDVYAKNYVGAPIDGSARLEGGADRVLRGGSYEGSAQCCCSTYRSWRVPSYRGDFFGFRLILSLRIQ